MPAPVATPTNSASSRFRIGEALPTAASALSPTYMPTMTESAVLYICCARLPISIGRENSRIRRQGAPCDISCAEKSACRRLFPLLLPCFDSSPVFSIRFLWAVSGPRPLFCAAFRSISDSGHRCNGGRNTKICPAFWDSGRKRNWTAPQKEKRKKRGGVFLRRPVTAGRCYTDFQSAPADSGNLVTNQPIGIG